MKKITLMMSCLLVAATTQAATPLWTFTPLTSTSVTVTPNSTATIQYRMTNQSRKTHRLVLMPTNGITQNTTSGKCANPFTLATQQSCILSLEVSGSALAANVMSGPVVCEDGNRSQCYQPNKSDMLQIQKSAATAATISVGGSPLVLETNGATQTLTVTNTSNNTTALNISSDFSGTALDGKVTETGNTCASLAPSSSCTLTFIAGSDRVPLTSFPIKGSNTNTINATFTLSALFAYVTNGFASGANNVTRCEVLGNGNFSGCVASGTNLSNPTGIAMHPQGNFAYITNLDTQDVAKCSFDVSGDLTNCTTSGSGMHSPAGIVLNTTGTLAYIANAGADNVSKCEIAMNGDLNNCSTTASGLGFPIGIAMNADGTRVYLTNFTTNDVTNCEVDMSGNLTNCSNSGLGLQAPTGIAINAAGDLIYVVNNGSADVSKCQIASNGNLVNCAIAGGSNLTEPRLITFNLDETALYIANALGNNVTKCDIDGSGNLVNCAVTGASMNGSTGIQFKLF